MPGSTWTQADDSRLRALWDAGHSTAEIGRITGRGKNSIVGRAHRLGLPSRASPIAVPDRRRLSVENLALVRGMVCRGYSQHEIARHMHCCRKWLSREMRAAGLAMPRTAEEAKPRPTKRLRAEAFRRHAQPGGGVSLPGHAAHQIPASAGVPVRPGYAEAPSLSSDGAVVDDPGTLPPAVVTPRPAVFSAARTCRWPIGEPRTSGFRFCEAPVRAKRDGTPCVYCADHAARAYTRTAAEEYEAHRVTRSTFAWGGRAA